MSVLVHGLAVVLVTVLQALPLRGVARIGRCAGALAYWLDARHRRVALRNLARAFPERASAEVRALARENSRRIGEAYCCAIKTAAMSADTLRPHLEYVGVERLYPEPLPDAAPPRIMAIGHFGNFELYARFGQFMPGVRTATTYRAQGIPALDRLLQTLRARSGCLYFERRTDAAALKAAMRQPGLILGLLADQHAGAGGVWIPFLGRDCSTSVAPAVFALRYHSPLFTAVCYRTALAQWSIEVGAEIPTREAGRPRPIEAIMCEVNRAFETAIRRDPANWFWVHDRWKDRKRGPRRPNQPPATHADAA